MKLRNKKTGAVANYSIILQREAGIGSNKAPIRYGCGTLAKLNEEWEDYEPTKPLIKDEKIRKAVRAWAEANGIKEIIIFDHTNNAPYTPVGAVDFAQNSGHLKIQFRTEELFDTNRIYAIEELCGEEEE